MKTGYIAGKAMSDLGFLAMGATTYCRSPSNNYAVAFGTTGVGRSLPESPVDLTITVTNFGDGVAILDNPTFTVTSVPSGGTVTLSPTTKKVLAKNQSTVYTVTYTGLNDGQVRGTIFFSPTDFNTINPYSISNIRFQVTTLA